MALMICAGVRYLRLVPGIDAHGALATLPEPPFRPRTDCSFGGDASCGPFVVPGPSTRLVPKKTGLNEIGQRLRVDLVVRREERVVTA